MSGRPKAPVTSQEEQLRQLTREANAAVKDLRDVLRQARDLKERAITESQDAARLASHEEMQRVLDDLQNWADKQTKMLADGVERARLAIIKALTMDKIRVVRDSQGTGTGLHVTWRGANFDPGEIFREETDDEQEAQAGPDPAAAMGADAGRHPGHA